MSESYVTRCIVEIDGQQISDFKNYREGQRELRRMVKLMNKVGVSEVTPSITFGFDYVPPTSGTEYPFESISNSAVTVELDGGRRVTFSGVAVLSIGESRIDSETELVRPIEFGATSRRVE
jgi:hypothetical protein